MTADESQVRAPRLTRLDVQGFKSFLHRTVIAFEPGITAVVGPNGSGKSNVADAVRWVLGEQGQAALRARKTEDVIFNGSQGRSPAGMAEATLTFDNSEGWLPTEFTEVSVTRRAFRSGENQYLINGRKVRLKDVARLTAGLGQSHVVVGQGLVDAALSLRAEERRSLFEHAAGLTGLRLKVVEAERNLAETEANTQRLADLLLELEPRLKSLQRAARQAQEWQGVRDRLRELQLADYQARLTSAVVALESTREEAQRGEELLHAARHEEARLQDAATQSEQRLAAAQQAMADHDGRIATASEAVRRLGHERDLAAARLESLARRRADMDDARSGLDERVEAVTADLARLADELRDLERTTQASRETVARNQREMQAARQARAELDRRTAAVERQMADHDASERDLERRQTVLSTRQGVLSAEHERLQAAIVERAQRVTAIEQDAATAASAAALDAEREAQLAENVKTLAATLQVRQQEIKARRVEADKLHQERGNTAARLDALRRLQESGAGLHGGVRETMAAARRGTLAGVRGMVAELIEVPPRLETAIEVALGGRLQDIVVERWADAEAAIAHLKASGTGRATFQPLDSIRQTRAGAAPAGVTQLAGYLGVAVDLIEAPPELQSLVASMLGRTIVVDNLPATRAALRHLSAGWSVVTLGGEIARSGGSVTGGAAVKESGTLGRERELRDLPQTVARLEQALVSAHERVDEAETALQSAQGQLRQAEDEQAALRAAAEERRQHVVRAHSWLRDQQQEQTRAHQRFAELAAEEEQVGRDLAEVAEQIDALGAVRARSLAERASVAGELATLAESHDLAERTATAEGRRLAGLEERLRGERRREAHLRSQERALAEELALRAERTTLIDRERATLTADHQRLVGEADRAARELEALRAARVPVQAQVAQGQRSTQKVTAELKAARELVVSRERESDHVGFALERLTTDWEALRLRIAEDLDLEDPDTVLDAVTPQLGMPVAEREKTITQLRERLRRMGYAGDDAVADYERERTHHDYLREQLADVQGAAAALHTLVADLRQTMRNRFDGTVAEVGTAFAEAFAILFGGGTARLVLAAGDGSGEPGVEIIAQPPGKKLQGLALLSGGERALTAAALLFAILKVNPVPFCLLDEVDAALDEANVVRFRERLQELARQTQIIVVTHNRATIEIADILYGVSMGADGVSQVLSLRMSESLPPYPPAPIVPNTIVT